MARKIIKLTESDLHSIVKRVIKENKSNRRRVKEDMENFLNPEAMETGDAILTMVLTTLGLLGAAGSHYIKAMIEKLRKRGEDDKADQLEQALMDAKSGMSGGMESDKTMSSDEDEDEDEMRMMESRYFRRNRRR